LYVRSIAAAFRCRQRQSTAAARSLGAGSRYRSTSAGARAAAAGSCMLRYELDADLLRACATGVDGVHWTLLALRLFLPRCGAAAGGAVCASLSSYGLCDAENGRALMVSSARRERDRVAVDLLLNSRLPPPLPLADLDDADGELAPRLLAD